MLNLMVGLNAFTLCSGIISEDLNGVGYRAVPLKESQKMRIGYINRRGAKLSSIAQQYIEELAKYESYAYNKDQVNSTGRIAKRITLSLKLI